MKVNYRIFLIALLGLSSCESSRQFEGTVAGSMVGGMFGSSIGGLKGGWRGSDAGTALGMLIGGAVGNVATAPRAGSEAKRNTAGDDTYQDDGETYRPSGYGATAGTPLDQVVIEDLRFIDSNRNRRLDADERGKFIFHIYNRGSETVYNVAPCITSEQGKRIILSPSAIVSSLAPGKGVRYTADVYATRRVRSGETVFRIDLTDGRYTVRRREFALPVEGRK